MNKLVTKRDLMQLGYSKYASEKIISNAKRKLVEEGFEYYMNRRIGKVPLETVEKILGTKLD